MAGLGKFRRTTSESEATEVENSSEAISMPPSTGSTAREFVSEPDADEEFLDDEHVEDDSPEAALRASDRQRIAAADALSEWIKTEQPINYKILQRLEKDIRANRQLNEWGSFALDDLLRPPMADHSRLQSAKWGHLVTVARNLLLFAPVLVTWTAIERAASEYKKLPVGSAETFLNVWQRLPMSLSVVAFLDAFVIGALIALTLVSHLLEARAETVARHLDDDADRRFRDVMVEVGLFLHGFRQITPSALKGGLADAVNQLKEATTEMNNTAISMSEVADKAVTTLEEFAALSAKEFAPAADRLATLATTLEATTGAHAEMSKLVSNMQGNLETTLGSLSDGLDKMTSKVISRLEENAVSLQVALAHTVEHVDRIGTNLEASAVATSAAVEAMALRGNGSRDR